MNIETLFPPPPANGPATRARLHGSAPGVPDRISDPMPLVVAVGALIAFQKEWEATKPGRCAKWQGGFTLLCYYSDGKLHSAHTADMILAPAHDEPGQPRRKMKTEGK
jgi:hypothetical protein